MLDSVGPLFIDNTQLTNQVYPSTGFGLSRHLEKQLSPTLITRNGPEGGSPS